MSKEMNGRLIRYKLFEMSFSFIEEFHNLDLALFLKLNIVMQIYLNNMSVIICILDKFIIFS